MLQISPSKIVSINGTMPTSVALASAAVVALRPKSFELANTGRQVAATPKPCGTASPQKDPKTIARLDMLLALIGISRSTVYNRINPKSKYYDPMFPRPIRLGARAVGWVLEDVYAYIEHLRHQQVIS